MIIMIMFGDSDWIKTYDEELDRIRNLGGRIRMHWMMITWIGEASIVFRTHNLRVLKNWGHSLFGKIKRQ